MTSKQNEVSEQSMSISENNLAGTVPSVIDKPPPIRVERRPEGGETPPGKEDGDTSETVNDSAAAKISSRNESDEDNMTSKIST